jgi:transposase
MDQVHVIRHQVLVEGRSIRSVAGGMGISRNTVRKYLVQPVPVRRESGPRARPVWERVARRIEELLEEWSPRTTPKQRVTGTRLHRQLVEEGHRVGITTVRVYLAERRRQAAEVYIPLVHRAGEEVQVDFFDVTVEEDGRLRKAWKFLMRLMYSPRDFVHLYDDCSQLSFLDGHVRAFAHFGGVPRRAVYDNLSAAVKRRLGLDRELTERFRALSSQYLFEPCFARPGEGHDKGGVESRGKGIRLQHLTPVPRGASLAAMSASILAQLDADFARRRDAEGRSAAERFAEEAARLRPLPAVPFDPRKVVMVQVSRRSLVRVEAATYSVPSSWAGLAATAYVGIDDVRIVCRGQQHSVARKRRGQQEIRYRHYLKELARKPQAVRQVAPELLAELGPPYERLWSMLEGRYGGLEAGRIVARLLGAILDHGEAAVSDAVQAALGDGCLDLLHLAPRAIPAPATVAVPEPLASYQVEAARAADFDVLLSGGGR